MCGLAGIICFDERLCVETRTLSAMLQEISHRGPDAQGRLDLSGQHFSANLLHCRLSILDLDPRANQPMQDATGRFTIIFNGEIYNFRELRAELEKTLPQFQFRTTCDTEVIIAAYQAWGEKCVARFNGMFAFVIVDQDTRTVFAARDRMGQKPLYFAAVASDGSILHPLDQNGMQRPIAAIAFASELDALFPIRWIKRQVRQEMLQSYLLWGYIPSPDTMYQGVYSLPPAHAMTIVLQQARAWRYFDPNQPAAPLRGETPVDATRRLMIQAVRRQLIADVPVGCFLSGGIDSSIIAAAMRQVCEAGQEILTFSVGYKESRFDETPYAQAVADHLKTKHHKFIVEMNVLEDLPKVVRSFGQPFADSSALPTHYLARATREHVKVALSGDGGDELFGGYDRYRAMHISSSMHPAIRQALSLPFWQWLPGAHPKSRVQRFKRFVRPLNWPPAQRYANYMELFEPRDVTALLGDGASESYEAYLCAPYDALLAHRDPVQAATALDRLTYLPEDLLVKVDRCSMQYALEVRNPFMDHELVQFAAGLHTPELIGQESKTLLRKAFARDLPANHFDRPKMGFAIPIGDWFRGELRGFLRETLHASGSFAASHFNMKTVQRLLDEHDQGKRDHAQRLYALLVLELWHR